MIGRRTIASCAAGLAVFCFTDYSTAADPEFAFSLGYSHISLDDTTIGEMGEAGGLRFETRYSWAPNEQQPKFRLGLGMGFSFFYDETDGSALFIDDDGDIVVADADDYEQVFLWTPELQLSWRERWDNGWMLEGGVGVGGVVGVYAAGDQFFDEFYDQDLNESDFTFFVRPFVRAAYRDEGFSVGLEASYMWGGSVEFTDEVGGDVEEWYVGVFFGFAR